MNVRRFTARTAREALAAVRNTLGEDAVVLSNKPAGGGVEIVAMAPESIAQFERVAAATPVTHVGSAAAPQPPLAAVGTGSALNVQRDAAHSVAQDVNQLGMSTMSFQSYVRERMLKRREAALREESSEVLPARVTAAPVPLAAPAPRSAAKTAPAQIAPSAAEAQRTAAAAGAWRAEPMWFEPGTARAQPAAEPAAAPAAPQRISGVAVSAPSQASVVANADSNVARREQQAMMAELRQVKGLIEDRFGALAFMDKLQRHPAHARLTQKLLDCGFSAALIKKLTEALNPTVSDESAWAQSVLARNLLTAEFDPPLEDTGGVYALVGPTGVGKTTTTAKLAAAFAAKHGASHLGLITLDAYRIGAHEQLRAYGRILGVPVHTAHDKASLVDLLGLLSAKRLVLIDTAGMAQRDTRTGKLLDMLEHASVHKVLVLNTAAQGETLQDVIFSYRGTQARGVVLSKMDEAVKLAPALDAVIRHRLEVLGVANGQRVPEDWHRLPAHALVHLAMRTEAWTAYRVDTEDLPLVFSAPTGPRAAAARVSYA